MSRARIYEVPDGRPRRDPEWRRELRLRLVLGLAFSLLVAFVILGGMWLLLRPHVTPPDYEHTQAIVHPSRAAFCPGERFVVDFSIRINRVPALIAIAETIVDLDHPATVVLDHELDWTVHTQPLTITRTATVTVPSLPPGRYEWHQGAQAFDSPPSALTVPFVIPATCGAAP